MNLQDILDFSARHLLTQGVACEKDGGCFCQLGTLRCAAAAFAVESDVTSYGPANFDIPSIKIAFKAGKDTLLDNLISIHDDTDPLSWPHLLNKLAIKHGLQPFSPSDLSSGRGKVNPLSVWYTNSTQRERLLEAHKIAGTESLLADYLKAFPLDTSGIRESVLPTESQGVV